jgi:hypothetical protein
VLTGAAGAGVTTITLGGDATTVPTGAASATVEILVAITAPIINLFILIS